MPVPKEIKHICDNNCVEDEWYACDKLMYGEEDMNELSKKWQAWIDEADIKEVLEENWVNESQDALNYIVKSIRTILKGKDV